ncbi:N-acetylmuramoyl-L-alanine amidase family protein [Pontibacillus litoralis]|uniref:Acetylmuramoyl-L-alanine amidase n=1 Tax=Pontibacillus litoralis JSM 072002 TaxID=1385512 RepID=A0A0A5GA05_9BACI|nr:N-acetylmuramoyl-L-alanine amidase [Pontibacillus litoralis]KGX87998.1 acetylmuramoyl-L-alanine amidase [Pontibacillus litoralis JSM 072002]
MTKVVAIDIGHGSNTFPPSKGVYKNGKEYAEHDFNSKLGVELDKLLKHNGFKMLMKQKPFSPDVGLTTRTNYYNAKGVDLVYSLHANYNVNSDVNGRCVFYWHTANDAKELANIIVDEIKKAGYSTHGNGLHASKPNSWTNLHICRETHMTAVLVENGFMSGDKDFELIFGSKQKHYVKGMARVHAKAICRYYGVRFKDLDGTTVADKPSKPSDNIKVGDKVYLSKSASKYVTGQNIPSYVKGKTYTVQQVKGNKVLLKEIYSWVYKSDLGSMSSGGSSSNAEYVYLPSGASSWRFYPTNVAPTKGNEKAFLNPRKFGGLKYKVLGKPQAHVVTIQTSDFGKGNIYVHPSTGALIK